MTTRATDSAAKKRKATKYLRRWRRGLIVKRNSVTKIAATRSATIEDTAPVARQGEYIVAENNVSTALLDRRRDNEAYSRLIGVQAALRLWRRTVVAEMASAPFGPDNEKTEILLDLLHGELTECGALINATSEAAKRILDRRIEAGLESGEKK